MLDHLAAGRALRTPDAVAVEAPDGAFTYAELELHAARLAAGLAALGIGSGDRVLIWREKSRHAVVAMQAVLKLGAAFVPVDTLCPQLRALTIARDCSVRAVITGSARAFGLVKAGLDARFITHDGPAPPGGLTQADIDGLPQHPGVAGRGDDDLAYVLYTSGSTGRPKGVCLSHANALAFVRWSVAELGLSPADRLSNHAPFQFDLSVFDVWAAFAAGARTCLIPEATSYSPRSLVQLVRDRGITVWYSVPTALVLMMERGGLLELPPDDLRAILFAGEVFPRKHLSRLREWFFHPNRASRRLLNLYGPTETNVCTYHEVGDRADELAAALPIGRACCGDRVWLTRPDGTPAAPDEEGELTVEGPTVMLGYFGQPLRGDRPYPTGDIARIDGNGALVLIGRRDELVKVRGYRVEPGEIEAALVSHPAIDEAAVLMTGSGLDARLVAFIAGAAASPSLLAVKQHLAERLPRSMTVDSVRVLPVLPRTITGKIDRTLLALQAGQLLERTTG